VFTTAWSGYAHLYDAQSSRFMLQFQQQGGLVDASFSPDGRRIATACEDGNAWIWDPSEFNAPRMVLPQGGHIEQIAYSRDGRFLAVGGQAGRVRVWQLSPSERGVQRLPGKDVQWVEFDQSGRRALLLSTGAGSRWTVYDVPTAKLLGSATLDRNEITRVRFSPDGHRILAFGRTRWVLVFNTESGQLSQRLTHKQRVQEALWTPDGKSS
jgi:WD40 repeat protein